EHATWLRTPDPETWADALVEIVSLSVADREAIAHRARTRARTLFSMDAMANGLDDALQEAVAMGKVDVFGWVGTVAVMLLGFLLAYLVGPFLFPS
ncbi:hypothetical protein B0H34DRAFT_665753, partial [Crassisporium funariophilum]